MTEHRDIVRHWRELAKISAGIIPTKIPLDARPAYILAIRDDLDVLCDKVDALVQAYGEYVQHNSGYRIDPTLMCEQLERALDGQLLHEIEQAAETVRDRLHEAVA